MRDQNDYPDDWDNWNVAEAQQNRRWLVGLVAGLAGVCLLAACALGGYYFVWPRLAPATAIPAPPIPTVPGAAETETAVAQETAVAASTETPVQTPVTSGTTPAAATTAPTATSPAATASATTAAVSPSANVTAAYVAAPPTIDGTLSEYATTEPVPSAFRVYSADSWDGSADLMAIWHLLWDEQNLYVGVDVTDDIHVQTQSGNQIFRGDSLDMQIDTNPSANARAVNPNTYQIILSPGNFAGLSPSAFRFQGTEEHRIVDAPGGNQVNLAAQATGDGYRLEAAIPWSDLGVSPSEGMVLGLALNANDNDRPGQAIQEVMMSHVSTRTLTDPGSWGTLRLE